MTRPGRRDGLAAFAVGALAAAVPFWVAGARGARLPAPFDALPVTALGFCVPAAVAVGSAAAHRQLPELGRALTPPRARPRWWPAAAAAFAVPTLVDAALRGGAWPHHSTPRLLLLVVGYPVAALGEELGWTTFALPRLLRRTRSVPAAAAAASAYWAAWHLVPFLQTGNPPVWVAGQAVQTVLMRSTIVGLAAASADAGWLPVVLHAASNLAWSLSPPGYRPWVVDTLALPVAAAALVAGTRAVRRRAAAGGPAQA